MSRFPSPICFYALLYLFCLFYSDIHLRVSVRVLFLRCVDFSHSLCYCLCVHVSLHFTYLLFSFSLTSYLMLLGMFPDSCRPLKFHSINLKPVMPISRLHDAYEDTCILQDPPSAMNVTGFQRHPVHVNVSLLKQK